MKNLTSTEHAIFFECEQTQQCNFLRLAEQSKNTFVYVYDIQQRMVAINHQQMELFHSFTDIQDPHLLLSHPIDKLVNVPLWEDVVSENEMVLSHGIPRFSLSIFYNESAQYDLHTTKIPLMNTRGKAHGILGITQILKKIRLSSSEEPKLSQREKQCYLNLLNGLTAKEIASKLNLSIRTIESYIEKLFHKLSIHSRAELVQHAIKNGTLHLSDLTLSLNKQMYLTPLQSGFQIIKK